MPAIIPIRAFSDNYVWAIREGARASVVDPGDAGPVLAWLDREGVTLSSILVTHHHNDHVGGIPTLLARHPVPVFGPAREDIPGRTVALREGDVVDVPDLGVRLQVIDVPGHTAGHIAYAGKVGSVDALFCGDTLFAGGCGRLFEGSPRDMWTSLAKLAALPGETRVYCAHEYTLANLRFAAAVEPGNTALHARRSRDQATRDRGEPTVPSLLADELATNPFLRVQEPAVSSAASMRAGRPVTGPVETFAVIREWKNGF